MRFLHKLHVVLKCNQQQGKKEREKQKTRQTMTQAPPSNAKEVLEAALYAERLLDEEINRLNNLETEDYEVLREKRYKLLKLQHQQQQMWLSKKHGQYTEVQDEREWFEACQGSMNVVCHFYTDSSMNCKIMDKHLGLLAEKHPETRFIKINAEKSPFLTQRLSIWMMPTVLLLQNSQTVDKLEGFAALGNKEDFSTATLERYIRQRKLFLKTIDC